MHKNLLDVDRRHALDCRPKNSFESYLFILNECCILREATKKKVKKTSQQVLTMGGGGSANYGV